MVGAVYATVPCFKAPHAEVFVEQRRTFLVYIHQLHLLPVKYHNSGRQTGEWALVQVSRMGRTIYSWAIMFSI